MTARVNSFKYAIEGIKTALKDQPNFKIHLLLALAAIILSFVFNIGQIEWLIVILTIGIVISLELTNTAIEEVVNSFTDQVHPSAKKAKDVAAGAVLIASILAICVGCIIFLPHLIKLLP